MEHSELVQEMLLLEKMTAQERLKHARRRRQQQLKNWIQREKELLSTTTTAITSLATTSTIPNGENTMTKAAQSYLKPLTSFKHLTKNSSQVKFPQNVVLLDATARQDVDEVRRLLQSGNYNPNTANEDGLSPIHQCSIDNSEQLLLLLIEFGGDVNARDRDLWTPLHAAATCGHMQICKILIEHGAELLALNADGNMPYDICDDDQTLDYIETQMDQAGITQEMIDTTRSKLENQMLNDLQQLVKKKISHNSSRTVDDVLSYRNSDGATPLHIAAANGYQFVVEYLLRQHISINVQDNDGWTPLHAAAFWCQQSILALLIEAGGDIYEKVPDQRNAIDLCDDPDIRTFMTDYREQCIRNQQQLQAAQQAAAQAAAQQQQQKSTNRLLAANGLPPPTTARTGTLYESRSSVSSPYGSGSSLNRTSSIRRASLRDREKVKKLNANFFDVLEAKDKIHEDVDEATITAPPIVSTLTKPSTSDSKQTKSPVVKEEQANSSMTVGTDITVLPSCITANTTELQMTTVKKPAPMTNMVRNEPSEMTLSNNHNNGTSLRPLPSISTTSVPLPGTLIDVKRKRDEKRRAGNINDVFATPIMNGNGKINDNNHNEKTTYGGMPNNITNLSRTTLPPLQHQQLTITNNNDLLKKYSSPKHVEIVGHLNDDQEKRICCVIL
ncbi:unnamed protein product [Didymodactylos carnosus]|uniref:Protein phosphatase 1 regulatory inhibitor subunit 16B n=1 Tax=Didymodactylos carnosus TaxID=1234261 RepID=A0A813SAK3_9BILA|nr:unnamed protein product [Didymodactylos carnosus]CAF0895872.1 unnamed protein product [Didymodactylos carnosus]CAF3576641.1 unnamed protein product [Didymodactylos carnosus]CAF3677364.1 unnamed protein product [Didymodactylos carnosus]